MQLHQLLQLSPDQLQQYIKEHEEQVVAEMLKNIGNPSAEMREAVNYQLFAQLLQQQMLQPQSVKSIATHIANEELLVQNIAAGPSDDVFTRSASALWMLLLLQDKQAIDDETYSKLTQQAITFLTKERDARGYIDAEHGWVDAVGVAAQLCYTVLRDERFAITQTANMLQAISKALWNEQVFTNNEDERFVKILMACIDKNIDEQLLIEWVEQVFDRLEYYSYEVGYTQQWFTARTNILQLMKTLYFHLKFSHQYEQLRATTSIFIQRWLKLS